MTLAPEGWSGAVYGPMRAGKGGEDGRREMSERVDSGQGRVSVQIIGVSRRARTRRASGER